jgi:chromosomal replication initiator protein
MNGDCSNIWNGTKAMLAETLSTSIFERWISLMEYSRFDSGTLFLRVPSGLYLDWVQDNYMPLIERAARSVDENVIRVELVVDKEMPLQERKTPRHQNEKVCSARPKRAEDCDSLNSSYTFDEFVVGDSNSFAHAAALAVAQAPAKAYNPLFIYGGVGLGKTHLMHAIGNHVFAHKHKRVHYVSSEDFVNEYISALQTRKLHDFRKKYRSISVLLIDDIHFLAGKDRMQEEFFHTFNSLHNSNKQIVLTSDKSPSELSGLEHRLVSRFEWGMVTQLEKPDLETRIAILMNKASEFSISMPEDMIVYLAENIRSNVRPLEGALIRLSSYMSLKNTSSLSIDEMEPLLHDILEKEKKPVLSIDSIQQRVAELFKVEKSEIVGKSRLKHIALPRQVAMYLARELTESSYPAIGQAFNKNHATVLHACKTVESKLVGNSDLRNTLLSIRKSIV